MIAKSRRKNIFLIGMMGSGKTSVGRLLAGELKMTFVDIDETIETVTEKSISEIFKEYGEQGFRELEGAFFREKAGQNNQVFSTGGGIILDEKNREVLHHKGFTVLLKASPDSLAKRIRNPATRPLLYSSHDLQGRLTQIWNKRQKLYESVARLSIATDDLAPGEAAERIIDYIRDIDEDN